MSENKDLRRRGQKNKINLEQSADIPMMATIRPGTRTTGASKILLDDHVHEALQNKSDDGRKAIVTRSRGNFQVRMSVPSVEKDKNKKNTRSETQEQVRNGKNTKHEKGVLPKAS